MLCIIPKPDPLKKMLAMLFGDDFAVGDAPAPDANGSYAGIYINPEGETVAACVADYPCAVNMSSALSMLPPDVAREAMAEGSLSEAMVANLYEVMNILTRLVMDDASMHIKLENVVPAAGHDGVSALVESGQRFDFSVNVPRYGDGVLSFLVT